MKKLLLLALVISLLLCFAAITMAAAEKANVYVDTMIGGTVDDPDDLGMEMLMKLTSGLNYRLINLNSTVSYKPGLGIKIKIKMTILTAMN